MIPSTEMNGTALILASIMAAMPNGPVPDGKPLETMGIFIRKKKTK